MKRPHYESLTTRRDFLRRGGAGFGAVALSSILGTRAALGNQGSIINPLQPRVPKLPGTAKRVIFLFMEGGPSHIDLCDPKPLLNKLSGQKLPESFGSVVTAMGESGSPLLGSNRTFKQHGESGQWFSDWLPEMASCADDFTVIKSCVADGINHAGGVCQMNTGSIVGGRPSLGSWVSYGLGSENQNLPAFVVLKDSDAQVINGVRNWGSGFMPAMYQGTLLDDGPEPFAHLNPGKGLNPARQKSKLDLLQELNKGHLKGREDFTDLEARVKSMELAFRMQATAPEAVDLSKETPATKKLYGMDEKETENFGSMCLLARRLAERGVRFIQLYHGAGSKWDAHKKIDENHAKLCKETDKPVAGLIKDLKARGLLDDTLVIWGGEFGRTPMSEKGNGRDHNPTGFSMIWAGGGVAGGQSIGETDELGLRAVENKLHVHDLHATILHLMGMDHTELIYHDKGRPERIDQNEGKVAYQITG